MARLLIKALLAGLIGLLLGPLLGLLGAFGLMMFDPACGSPGDSGGCAMGLLMVPAVLALLSFALFALVSLVRNLWRPHHPTVAAHRLRNGGRKD